MSADRNPFNHHIPKNKSTSNNDSTINKKQKVSTDDHSLDEKDDNAQYFGIKDLCDVTIKYRKKIYKIPSIYLCNTSMYFFNLLMKNSKESRGEEYKTIELPDDLCDNTTSECLEYLLNKIMNTVTQESLDHSLLCKVAILCKYFEMQNIQKQIEAVLIDQIESFWTINCDSQCNRDKIWYYLFQYNKFQMENLVTKCIHKISDNAKSSTCSAQNHSWVNDYFNEFADKIPSNIWKRIFYIQNNNHTKEKNIKQ